MIIRRPDGLFCISFSNVRTWVRNERLRWSVGAPECVWVHGYFWRCSNWIIVLICVWVWQTSSIGHRRWLSWGIEFARLANKSHPPNPTTLSGFWCELASTAPREASHLLWRHNKSGSSVCHPLVIAAKEAVMKFALKKSSLSDAITWIQWQWQTDSP